MTEEKSKFVLYDYLLYFLGKKKYFIIIPLLTTLLVAGLVYALKSNNHFTGEALVFTGSVDNDELAHTDNLKAEFSKVNPTVDVIVNGNHVKITLESNSKAQAEKDLKEILSPYEKKLNEKAKLRLAVNETRKDTMEKLMGIREDALALYNSKLEGTALPPDQYDEINELILKTEETISEAEEIEHKMKSDIALFEHPEILSQKVTKPKTYLPEGIAAGLILGLILTLVFLILLKYIEDARRYYKHD